MPNLNECESEKDWYILDLKQKVDLYDCTYVSWDAACMFFESFEELEAVFRRFMLTWCQDVESKAYCVWHWAREPPVGHLKARKDKLAPAPKVIPSSNP